MAKIGLSASTFTILPEGTQILECTNCTYDEKFGNLTLEFATKDGIKHIEKYMLIKSNGEQNDGALKAFSYTARRLLNANPDDVDTKELIGKYIMVTVEHEQVITKKGQSVTVARLNDKQSVSAEEVAVAWGDKHDAEDIDFDNLVI